LDKPILEGLCWWWEKHLTHLKAIHTRLQEVNLKLNPEKCSFGAQQIIFLGHVVTRQGSYLDPKKVQVVKDFPIPRTLTNVRAFLGLIGYYKNFLWDMLKLLCHFLIWLRRIRVSFGPLLVRKLLTHSSSGWLKHPSL